MSWRSKSYEVLPALSVRGCELRQSLRTVTIAWMFGIVWMSCAYGSHLKSYARMLGFGDFAFGIMAALPWLATFGQLVATIGVERTGLRKHQFLFCMTVSRAMWLLLPLIPLLLPVPSLLAVTAMLVVLGISSLMAALGTPAWYTWMGDLIPRRIRGRYMARRSRLCSPIQIVTVISLGILLDNVTAKDAPETLLGQPVLMVTACIVFVVAGIFGVTDVLLFRKIRELIPANRDRPRQHVVNIEVPRPSHRGPTLLLSYFGRYVVAIFGQVLIGPLKDHVFRSYVAYGTMMAFAMTVGGWYWWLNAMEHLGFSKLATNILFMAIGPVSAIVTANLWGGLIDRWGRRPVLLIATFGTIISVLPWFLATPDSPHPLFIEHAVNWTSRQVSGIFGYPTNLIGPETPLGAFCLIFVGSAIGGACWSALNLAQMGIILGFSDGPGRSKYVAASAVLISVGGAAGGILGGVVTEALHFLQDSPIGMFEWNNWHAAIALSLLARILGFSLALNMPDPGAGRVRDIFRLARTNAYNAVAPRLFYALRVVGWRRRSSRRRHVR